MGPGHVFDLTQRLVRSGPAEKHHDDVEVIALGARPLDHRRAPQERVDPEQGLPGHARLDEPGAGQGLFLALRNLDQERPALQIVVNLDAHGLQFRRDVVHVARPQGRFADLDRIEAGGHLAPLACPQALARSSGEEGGLQPKVRDPLRLDEAQRGIDHVLPLLGRNFPGRPDRLQGRQTLRTLVPGGLPDLPGELHLAHLRGIDVPPCRRVIVAGCPGAEAQEGERAQKDERRSQDRAGKRPPLQARTHGNLH